MITFYDLLSEHPKKWWAPNTYKVRFSLNYKAVPYETVGVHYPDVKAVSEKLGLGPNKDGEIPYTLPIIVDDGNVVRGSEEIARYLDGKYPQRPLFVDGTDAWAEYMQKTLFPVFAPGSISNVVHILDQRDKQHFTTTRTIRDVPDTYIEDLKASLRPVEETLSETPFLTGSAPSFADFFLASLLVWLQRGGERDFAEVMTQRVLVEWHARIQVFE